MGAPVVARDVDHVDLTYSLSGGGSLFEIEPHTGQIRVRRGALLDAQDEPTHVVTVTATDPFGESDSINVTITVTEFARPPSIAPRRLPGGVPLIGGGGGPPPGPTPSEVDFEWTVEHDIDELDAGNDTPTGTWSNGTILWVVDNPDGAGDGVYAYDLATGERVEDREFALDERNRAPRGVWSDRETLWVSDSGRNTLFAHDLATGERLPEADMALQSPNRAARGIWSDGETMWVLDGRRDALFAYDLESGELLAEYALAPSNGDPHGLWSDGVTVWISDHGEKDLLAYRLPTREEAEAAAEDASLERVRDEDFTKLSRASNNSPRGIWADGDVMYVADQSDDKVYTYNMPDAIDARLASLSFSGIDIGEFDPGQTDYEGVIAEGVTATAVTAVAMQDGADAAHPPSDADSDEANGHQVALDGIDAVTVTVMSADRSRTRVYRVTFEPAVMELVLSPTWTSLEWPGVDGVAIAEAGLPEEVVVVYTWDETMGSWLGYFPGLEDVPGLNTLAAFSPGVTYWIAAEEDFTWTLEALASSER